MKKKQNKFKNHYLDLSKKNIVLSHDYDLIKNNNDNQNTNKKNNFSFKFGLMNFLFTNWKKISLISLFLCLIFGTNIVEFFNKTIRALNSETEITNLYVNDCQMEYDIEDNNDKWEFINNLKNKPDVFEQGPSFLFSKENSGFYKGGNRSLVCRDFKNKKQEIGDIENVQIKLSLALFDSSTSSIDIVKISTTTVEDIYNDTLGNIIGSTTVGTTTVNVNIVSTSTIDFDIENSTTTDQNTSTSTEINIDVDSATSTQTSMSTSTNNASSTLQNSILTDMPITSTVVTNNATTTDNVATTSSNNRDDIVVEGNDNNATTTKNDDITIEATQSETEADESDNSVDQTEIEVDADMDIDMDNNANNSENVTNTDIDTDTTSETQEIQDSSGTGSVSMLKNGANGLVMQIKKFFDIYGVMANNKDTAKIILQYSIHDSAWHDLGEINSNNITNAINGDYFTYNASFLKEMDDIDGLKIKIKTENILENNLTFYIDSVWLNVEHEKKEVKSDKDVLVLKNTGKDRTIRFKHTDDNTDENLVIKTDRKNYIGLTEAEVYFNIENKSSNDQIINTQFYFPYSAGEIIELKKLNKDIPKKVETPMFAPKLYRCDDGWVRKSETNNSEEVRDYYECEKNGMQEECNKLSDDDIICYVPRVKIKTVEKTKYNDEWNEIELFNTKINDKQGLMDKWFGLDRKEVSNVFRVDKSSFKKEDIEEEGVLTKIINSIKSIVTKKKNSENENVLKSGETQYYMARIKFPVNSDGEFYIEAIGDNGGYGLLDPWWSSGWNYRMPITIDNSSNLNTLTDYQIFVKLDSGDSDFWSNVKSDGGDVRFINGAQDTALDFWIQDWNYASNTASIWVQVDSMAAATTSEIFMYYGNSSATTTSDQYAPFTYSSMEDLFYVVTNEAGVSVEVVSLIDGNQVQLDNQTAVDLNRQELTTFNPVKATSTLRAKGPVYAKVTGDDNVDALVPISFAAKQFAVPSTRGVENFHSYAPFATSTVTIYDATTQEQQQIVNKLDEWTVSNDISSMGIVEATEPILLSFDNDIPDDGFVPYKATDLDLYGISSKKNYIGVASSSSFSIYCSGVTSVAVATQNRGASYNNTTCNTDANGAGDAVRITSITGKIGSIQQADSDGGESTTFLPRKEFSSEYMIPTDAGYLAIACAPESGSVEISVFNELNVFVASSTCMGTGNYPGKVLFNATTYNAGSRIVSTNNKPFYVYYEDNQDETNLWGAVQSRKYSYNNPSYVIENEEPLKAPITTINSVNQEGESGLVNFSINVSDESNDDVKVKIEYTSTSTCDFASTTKPFLATSSIIATYGSPVINNDEIYQIGTSSRYIITKNGTNTVEFNWDTKKNLANVEDTYCVKLTANDGFEDQVIPVTSTVEIDNVAPTNIGTLSLNSKDGNSVTLSFGAPASDKFFDEYKIFYKEFDGSSVSESDSVHSSSTDSNLSFIDFNGATTTMISGLTQGIKYAFNIWAYDKYGHSASSSSELLVVANSYPVGYFNSVMQKTDGSGVVDISTEVSDNDGDECKIKIEYEAGTSCDFNSIGTLSLDTLNVSADVGLPVIDNNNEYQVGTSSGWIITSVGANTVDFDWLAYLDEPTADNTYCLRILVNDGIDDQISYATTTLILDNIPPVATGDLVAGGTTADSIKLLFATSTPGIDTNEPNFNAYKIFYKEGTSSVDMNDTEYDISALNAYDYNGVASTTVTGLNSGLDYVFNIFTFDGFGAVVSSTEVTIRTDSSLKNDSLLFVNHLVTGTSTNILVNSNENVWTFRANVSEANGWQKINEVYLKLADDADHLSPFGDLEFKWSQSSDVFTETGLDVYDSATLLNTSFSNCTSTICELNFNIILNKKFASTTVDYSAELYSTNDLNKVDEDTYLDFYQARKSWVGQMHYRWRNDNGAQ